MRPLINRREFKAALRYRVVDVAEDTVADYLRTFADFASVTDGGLRTTPLLVEDVEDVDFYSPLNELEVREISDRVTDYRLSPPEETTNGFAITANALVGDQVRRVRYDVYMRSVEGLDQESIVPNDIHVELIDDAPPISGLPGNRHRNLESRPTPAEGRICFQPDASGWTRVEPRIADAIVQDINRQVVPLVLCDDSTVVFRKPLPFYGLDLIEVRACIQNGEHTNRFFVWEPGLAASLDTRGHLVTALSQHLHETRGWTLESGKDAGEYLKFFVDHDELSLRTKKESITGRYKVLCSRDDAALQAIDPATVRIHPDAVENAGWSGDKTADDFLNAITEPIVRENDIGGYTAVAVVFCDSKLVLLKVAIDPKGQITIERHGQLLEWSPARGAKDFFDAHGSARPPAIGFAQESRLALVNSGDLIAETLSSSTSEGRRNVAVRGKTICGPLEIVGQEYISLVFEDCRFRNQARFSHVNCSADLEIRNSVFERGLEFSNVTLRGRLSLENVAVCGRIPVPATIKTPFRPDFKGMVLANVSVRNVSLIDVSLFAGLLAPNLQVQGDVVLQGLQSMDSVDLESGDIENRLEITTMYLAKPSYIHGDLTLDNTSAKSIGISAINVAGSLRLISTIVEQYIDASGGTWGAADDGTSEKVLPLKIGHFPYPAKKSKGTAGELNLYGTIIERNHLALQNIDIAGDLQANFVRVGTGVFLEPHDDNDERNRIGGDVDIGGSEVPQLIRIRCTDIDGNLTARGLNAGEFRMVGSVFDGKSPQRPDDCATPINCPLRVGGGVYLPDARVAGEIYVLGVSADKSLNLRHATIGGDLTLSLDCEEAYERGLLRPRDAREGRLTSNFPDGVKLRKSTVSGDIVLSGVDCSAGGIDLADTTVQRDIELLPDGGLATARALRLEGLRCDGSVDLSGLALDRGCIEEGCCGRRCTRPKCKDKLGVGHVEAKGARILGHLRTASEDHSARIPGCLDLSFSEIGTLELSVDTFPLPDAQPQTPEACGVILQRASIGMLAVHCTEGNYPRPTDFRYAEIKWWEFNKGNGGSDNERDGDSRSSDNPADYIALLQHDKGLQRHTWRAIENNLHNWGHEDAADEVHRAMRRWLRDKIRDDGPGTGLLKNILWYPARVARRIGDYLTDDVTSPLRLLRLMGFWLVLSTYLLSISENMGLSEPGYLTLPPDQRYVVQHPDPSDWGLLSGFWTALQFHVPVAAFTARDEWEPSNDEPMVIYRFSDMLVRLPWNVTAEDYGNLVLVTHWIAWPVVIVLASRKFLRRAQQQ
ncbi:MAG: pentapeptide repeat-containing protein [Gammaproteobacteria bacterium]|nr:pentapeptide repeat-containing protein [Gammaproteobacteria bacterium]